MNRFSTGETDDRRFQPVGADSGRRRDCTLRGMAPVERAVDGWFRYGAELGEIAGGSMVQENRSPPALMLRRTRGFHRAL